jgi:cyclopropane-fatty-acyl-phospholipid synthase
MALADSIYTLLDAPPGVGVEAYDGSRVVPDDAAAVIVVRRPEAVGRLVRSPGELGLVRAYVSGDVELDGDLFALIELGFDGNVNLDPKRVVRLLAAAGPRAWRSVISPPPPPPEEVRLKGGLHSVRRDAAAISHHYDVSNRYYELLLGPSMTYSCAVFAEPGESLEVAQERKLELISTKLGLQPDMRMLDVGCGWGQLLIHAAQHHGVDGVGITISKEQAELAEKRVADAGVADQIEIRLQDYRDVTDGPFDAISSIGMFEHVGRAGMQAYAQRLAALLAEGGRLLNHAIARPIVQGRDAPPTDWKATLRRLEVAIGSSVPSRIDSQLMNRYVFPDGELHELGDTITLLQEVGLEVRHSESLREHYALTLRHWLDNLQANWDEAVREVGAGRARVWKLYMTACAIGFERHSTEIHQVLAIKPERGADAHLPLRPHFEV